MHVVCVWEREREREMECLRVCVCVCVCDKERMFVHVFVCECVCMCMLCVCVEYRCHWHGYANKKDYSSFATQFLYLVWCVCLCLWERVSQHVRLAERVSQHVRLAVCVCYMALACLFQYSNSSQHCVKIEEDCAYYYVFFSIPIAANIVLRQKKIVRIIMSFSVFQ